MGSAVRILEKACKYSGFKGNSCRAPDYSRNPASEKKKRESASDTSQKLMLTWLVTYPGIFDKVAQYLTPEDFVVPLYREVAQMLFQQRKRDVINPARLLNSFPDSEEQRG